MKELDQHIKKGDKVSIVRQKQKEFQHVLNGVIAPQPGQKVWSVNKITLEVKEAEYTTEAIKFEDAAIGVTNARHKLVIDNDCIYIAALKKEGALKKYNKNKLQAHYYRKEPPAMLGDYFYGS